MFLTLLPYYLSLNKKTAPGIPETVLKEPKLIALSLRDKLGSLLPEALEIRITALAQNGNWFAVIQTHHAHEAFGIDLPLLMPHHYPEWLHSSQGNKRLYVPKGTYMNWKLMHIAAPHSVQT